MVKFQIVHAGDPRYLGGTSSALRTELTAGVRAGYSTAFLPYLGQRSSLVTGMEPRVAKTLADLDIPLLTASDAVETDLLLAHHPLVFQRLPDRPVRLKAKRVVVVLHHPVRDGRGVAQYDVERLRTSVERTYGVPVSFAPIGPVIRQQFAAGPETNSLLLPVDLPNLIDMDEWPLRDRPAPRTHAVIGRHSRDDPLKWPETEDGILNAYPASDICEVRVLGGASVRNIRTTCGLERLSLCRHRRVRISAWP